LLDDVQRRPLLEQPARKDPPPRLIGAAQIELDERAGQDLRLPRRGALASTQMDHGVTNSRRLAGLERDVARLAVTLVEEADHRDTLRHRRRAVIGISAAWIIDRGQSGNVAGLRAERIISGRSGLLRGRGTMPLPEPEPAPDYDQDRHCRSDGDAAPCHASGTQAS
jgi:hypothetical protein